MSRAVCAIWEWAVTLGVIEDDQELTFTTRNSRFELVVYQLPRTSGDVELALPSLLDRDLGETLDGAYASALGQSYRIEGYTQAMRNMEFVSVAGFEKWRALGRRGQFGMGPMTSLGIALALEAGAEIEIAKCLIHEGYDGPLDELLRTVK